MFDDEGLLRQFRVEDDDVQARLGDANHSLTFGAEGLRAALYQRDSDEHRLQQAIKTVFELLQPGRLSRPTFGFQWVAPLDDVDYNEARKAAAAIAIPLQTANSTDFALYSDGTVNEPEEANFFLECGIVEAAELPGRLTRVIGRMGVPDPNAPPSLWPRDVLPDVAFFCDSTWSADTSPPSLGDFFHLWEGTRTASGRVVSELMTHFNLTQHE